MGTGSEWRPVDDLPEDSPEPSRELPRLWRPWLMGPLAFLLLLVSAHGLWHQRRQTLGRPEVQARQATRAGMPALSERDGELHMSPQGSTDEGRNWLRGAAERPRREVEARTPAHPPEGAVDRRDELTDFQSYELIFSCELPGEAVVEIWGLRLGDAGLTLLSGGRDAEHLRPTSWSPDERRLAVFPSSVSQLCILAVESGQGRSRGCCSPMRWNPRAPIDERPSGPPELVPSPDWRSSIQECDLPHCQP